MKLSFIGAGNMASAIIRGVVRSGFAAAGDITACDISAEKTAALKGELGIIAASDNISAVKNADYIFLCVKPQILPAVCEELRGALTPQQTIVSIAAGVTLQSLRIYLGDERSIVRVMPNLPLSVGEGMCMVCKNNYAPEAAEKLVVELLSGMGEVVYLDEKYLNAFVALASSSPAFIFMVIEAMADGGVLMGLPRAESYKIAAQAVLGSARMVLDTEYHPAELKDMVCSPAGTTIDAVASLEQNGLRYAMIRAMQVCMEKCEAMEKVK